MVIEFPTPKKEFQVNPIQEIEFLLDVVIEEYVLPEHRDADVDGGEVQQLYFPKGGWVDFTTSDIDDEGNGTGTDEEGRQWEFRGLVEGPSLSEESDSDSEDSDQADESEEDNEDP